MTRFDKIIQNLAKIPDELAFEIINDLSVWDVMKLLVANGPRVNALLLAHKECKFLGNDAETQAKTREQIKIYLDLETNIPMLHYRPDHMGWMYTTSIRYINHWCRWKDWPDLTSTMHVYIYETLHNWPKLDLNRYAVIPIPAIDVFSSLEQFTERGQALQLAKTNLEDQCTSQLQRAATLLEDNPDILKRTLDPEQKRRPNTEHIVSRLRYDATRFFRAHKSHPFANMEFFRYEFFPLIPFDEALVKLLDWIEEFEIGTGDQLYNSESRHSPSILKAARIVVDGMPVFYNSFPVGRADSGRRVTTNEKGEFLRTVKTPWSQKPTSWLQEVDMPSFAPHKLGRTAMYRRNAGLEPCDKEEERWLVSFIDLYRYLEALKSSKVN
ncbi:uncharacterized protein N7503_010364 [Penicillium pulvis]|uniref:uncharacterized protein n=1 Tax=Penicillium pulvis TaxID=1562058 RepID=UPI00254788F5|nr:uncharacterized protein N7503_010364 [Penicillium pulvis]KAJ5785152.1 hypothetical protein N7503_010364 [Penicillium pulvis]